MPVQTDFALAFLVVLTIVTPRLLGLVFLRDTSRDADLVVFPQSAFQNERSDVKPIRPKADIVRSNIANFDTRSSCISVTPGQECAP